jgi:hypothetical protein
VVADGGMLWVVGLMIVGIVGFILMLATAVGALVSMMARAGRTLIGLSGDSAPRACGRCQHVNAAHARYCAQCGRALGAERETTDVHG